MTHFLLKNFRFQIILSFLICLLFTFQSVNAQEDTMFIHLSSTVDFYPTSEIDSVTFHYGTTHVTDSMIIWQNNFSIAQYLVNSVDSISFSFSPTIYQPLIAYCEGIPMVYDQRDLSVYRTVKIGNQCWLRENLRYLPAVYSPNGLSYSELRYYIYDYYGDSLSGALNNQNYILYGALYNYTAALSGCPKGWRLPTNEEWDTLQNYLIPNQFNYDNSLNENKIAKSLTASSSQLNGGYWQNSNVAGTPGSTDFEWKRNLSGFSVLPGGLLALNGFLNINMESYFWGSSNAISTNQNSKSIYFNQSGLNTDLMPKQNGLSVRCIAKSLLIQTDSITNLSNHYVTLVGSIEEGAVPLIEKGFYLKKVSESSWSKYLVTDNQFSLLISNLDSLSTYHFFAFATNLAESKYGDTLEFMTYSFPICPGQPIYIDQRDNELYNTVKIGNQCWLKENLRYLPSISNLSSLTTTPNYYVYGYNGSNIQEAKATNQYSTFGVLYNRMASINGETNSSTNPSCIKGICPSGWHIPSESEFLQLIDTLGGASIAGAMMKSLTLWNNNGNGINSSFFTALPSGKMNETSFIHSGDGAYYWCSTKNTIDETATSFYINSSSSGVYNIFNNQINGLSVRCVRNELVMSIDSLKEITAQSVKIYSTITPGYDSVISRGIYWKSINENQWHIVPTLGLNFNISLSDLTPHTTYQILCFNLDLSGLKLSDTTYFTTLHTLPIPKIPSITKLYHNKVNLKFENTPGTLPISTQWYRYKSVDSTNWIIKPYSGILYIDTIQTLLPGNIYDITNVLVSQNDTLYSANLRFITSIHLSCPGFETFMDSRDSNYYSSVLINGTCWMKENLRYIPSVVPPNNNSATIPYYYVYGYYGTNVDTAKLSENYALFGTLYNSMAALNGYAPSNQKPSLVQGVCPDGWFLPSKAEWDALHSYLKEDGRFHIPNLPNTNVIKSCVATSTVPNGGMWNISTEPGSPGNNDFPEKRDLSGLSVLPGGCVFDSDFRGKGDGTYYWTSVQYFSDLYYVINYTYNYSVLAANNLFLDSDYASYVRCVKHSKSIAYTTGVTNVSATSITIKGKIIKGLGTVISQGFMWKPVEDTVWNTVLVSGDTISHNLNNLDSASVFEYKVFILTSTDTIYSLPQKFYTLGTKHCPNMPSIIDSRDSSVYNTIQIGDQCWMKENLRYLPKVTHNNTISSNDTLYYVYNFNDTIVSNAKLTNNYLRYGVLYNLNSVKTKVCPEGWVVPYQSNWDTLKTFLIINGYNYNALTMNNKIAKSLSGSDNIANGGYWTNSLNIGTPGNTDFPDYRNRTQLSFLPGGYITGGIPLGIDSVAKLWSYNPNSDNFSTMKISYNSDSIQNNNALYNDANYIRCVQYNPSYFDVSVSDIKATTVKVIITNQPGTNPSPLKNIKYKLVSNTNWQQSNGVSASFTLPNLTANSNYVIIGYYLYYKDTIWSAPFYFTTAPVAPTFSAITTNNITSTSVIASFNVTSGTQTILTRGIQYQAHNSNIWISISSTSNTVVTPINNLVPNTYYRVRGYASDSIATYYSNYVTFMTTSAVSNPSTNNNRNNQK